MPADPAVVPRRADRGVVDNLTGLVLGLVAGAAAGWLAHAANRGDGRPASTAISWTRWRS